MIAGVPAAAVQRLRLCLRVLNTIIDESTALVVQTVQNGTQPPYIPVEPVCLRFIGVAAGLAKRTAAPFGKVGLEIGMCGTNAAQIQQSHDAGHVFQRCFPEFLHQGEGTDFHHHTIGTVFPYRHLGEFSGIISVDFRVAIQNINSRIGSCPENRNKVSVLFHMMGNVFFQQIMAGEAAAVCLAPFRQLS